MPNTTRHRPAADGLPPLSAVIAQHDLRAKKSLSQNFILDLNLTSKIARCCGNLTGRTVVEIGPGPGGLTRGLLMEGAARVIAIETDERCLSALEDIAAHYPGRLTIVHADALAVDWAGLLTEHGVTDGKPFIAANLPYAIGTKLLINWLETEPWPPWYARMTLMFQKEVAERIVAQPGTRAYGRLAVLAQWRCTVDLAFTLPPDAFVPPPKVSSAVVTLTPSEVPQAPCNAATLSRVTAAAFGQRRKMLRASLRQLTHDSTGLLAMAGIDGARRAEDLDISEFARLANALDEY
jgi:16S rRNA (adenine1518-N6/adenine1519-N6)-dimethyltransferase